MSKSIENISRFNSLFVESYINSISNREMTRISMYNFKTKKCSLYLV